MADHSSVLLLDELAQIVHASPKSKKLIATPVMLIAKTIPMQRSSVVNIPRTTGRSCISVPARFSGLSALTTSHSTPLPISAFVSGQPAQYCVSGSASFGKPKLYLIVAGAAHAACRRRCNVVDGRSSRLASPVCKSSRGTQSQGRRRAQYDQDAGRAFPCRSHYCLPCHLRQICGCSS